MFLCILVLIGVEYMITESLAKNFECYSFSSTRNYFWTKIFTSTSNHIKQYDSHCSHYSGSNFVKRLILNAISYRFWSQYSSVLLEHVEFHSITTLGSSRVNSEKFAGGSKSKLKHYSLNLNLVKKSRKMRNKNIYIWNKFFFCLCGFLQWLLLFAIFHFSLIH